MKIIFALYYIDFWFFSFFWLLSITLQFYIWRNARAIFLNIFVISSSPSNFPSKILFIFYSTFSALFSSSKFLNLFWVSKIAFFFVLVFCLQTFSLLLIFAIFNEIRFFGVTFFFCQSFFQFFFLSFLVRNALFLFFCQKRIAKSCIIFVYQETKTDVDHLRCSNVFSQLQK